MHRERKPSRLFPPLQVYLQPAMHAGFVLCQGLQPCAAVPWHGRRVSRAFFKCLFLPCTSNCPVSLCRTRTSGDYAVEGHGTVSSECFHVDAKACRNTQDAQVVCPGFQGRSSTLQSSREIPARISAEPQPVPSPVLLSVRLLRSKPPWENGVGTLLPSLYTALCPYRLMKIVFAGRKGFSF